ncbi:hypothetical protein JYU34_016047 [Plutella xylostella]|uniref:FP protein C-terminal domain-containing protein n=2 Tax=Plutella xylostella TaxID=51655 RepID=A0ABQ7Q5B3_PLUXY|nr:hypothetical protein JYU34_016047 [Plutella xylostella]
MLRSPGKHHGSNPELARTSCNPTEDSGSITLRKRKREEDFSECFKQFSAEISATLSTWKLAFEKELSQINTNLNNIIKSDLKKLSENSLEMKAEISNIRKEYAEVKSSITSMKSDFNSLKGDVSALQHATQFISDQHDDLKIKFDNLSESTKKIEGMEAELVEVRKQNRQLKQEMIENDQRERQLNLEIVGLPELKEENLNETLIKIAKEVGITLLDSDIVHVNRITPRAKVPGRSRVIIAKMRNRLLKDNIISSARKSRLTTQSMGLGGEPKPVFVNEHLSMYNKQILRMAKDAARMKNHQFTWTKNGRIYVRKNDTSPAIRIITEDDLKKIM